MGTVLAVANQKGGVGKTTTAVNLGASIADAGYPTLLADLDPQCNATVALGVAKDHNPSVYDCLSGDLPLIDAAVPSSVEALDLVPSTPGLAGANVELPRIPGSETILRDRLGPVRDRYLFTLLDCPPSLGPLTVNALVAADKVIVPVQTEYFALEGLAQLLDTLSLIQRELNPRLTVAGMILTMHDGRTRLARDVERGLSAILPRAHAGGDGLREVPVELVGPNPHQPRRSFDERGLAELADSIRARGLLQPIVVRALPGGRYELLAGERRLRAARIAGLESVPALVREADERDQLDIALTENMAREDLNPVDEARACATLVEDLGLTKEELGRRVGRSRVAISNLIRLLDLPEETLELIERGDLSEGHGRAILLCKDHATRRALGLEARDGAWSVRETERRAREVEGGQDKRPRRGLPGPGAVIH